MIMNIHNTPVYMTFVMCIKDKSNDKLP